MKGLTEQNYKEVTKKGDICIIARLCTVGSTVLQRDDIAKITDYHPTSVDLEVKHNGFVNLSFAFCQDNPRLRLAYRNEGLIW